MLCSVDGDDGDGDGGGGDYVFFIGTARRSGLHDRLQSSPRWLCQRVYASASRGRARSVAEQQRTYGAVACPPAAADARTLVVACSGAGERRADSIAVQ